MTVVKLRPALAEFKNLLSADKDFLRPVVWAVPQEVLEAEMTEAPAAGKGERAEGRLATALAITRARWSPGLARLSSESRRPAGAFLDRTV